MRYTKTHVPFLEVDHVSCKIAHSGPVGWGSVKCELSGGKKWINWFGAIFGLEFNYLPQICGKLLSKTTDWAMTSLEIQSYFTGKF